MRNLASTSCLSIFTIAAATLLAAAPVQAQTNYFALGDSYAFGYTTPSGTGVGNGAPSGGYYAAVASNLATTTGKSVTTTNLAIPGETTYSFTGAADPFLPVPVSHTIADNTNYTTLTTQSAELASRGAVKPSFVTVQLGGNDIIQYLYESLYVAGATPTATANLLPSVIAASMSNYASILAQVKSVSAPNAKIFVVDYADPFAALNPALNPTALGLGGLDVTATQQFDTALQSLAQTSGVGFVDIASAFSNNAASSNYIGNFFSINDPTANTALGPASIPDFHPNSAGYGIIATQIENAAAAPEPDAGILLLMASGAAMGLNLVRIKRARCPMPVHQDR